MEGKKHWIKPLKGRVRPGRHLLLWVDADESKAVLKRQSCRAWDVVLCGRALKAWCLGRWEDSADLERILDGATKGKGELTIWIARGWEDLVLTGLAELLDCKACTWRYALLDGQRVLIRGLWRGKPVVISSLSNWTGHKWDVWNEVMADKRCDAAYRTFVNAERPDRSEITFQESKYLLTWCAIAQLTVALGCPVLAPTVASTGMMVWRRLIGPRIHIQVEWSKQKRKHKGGVPTLIVIPSPFRPIQSVCAERHSAYGLITRQLRRGFVDEMIHCVDLRAAYLLSLCTTPLPATFWRILHKPSVKELCAALEGRTAHALVRLKTKDYAYPVRYDGRVRLAQGHYWTWLAGAELCAALVMDEVQEIYTAHVWDALGLGSEKAELLLSLAPVFRYERAPAVAAAWRGVYSALIGQFAGRKKTWLDCPGKEGFGPWSEWESANCSTGELTKYRSIAGHVQRLAECSDTSSSVPFMYAVVTAHVRMMIMSLTMLAGVDNVVCLHCDSLWLTRAGWQNLQRRVSEMGMSPDYLACKATYDRVWMSGKSVCVIERNGTRSLKAPGIGDFAALDEACRAYGIRATHWSQCESVLAEDGCKRRKVVFTGNRIIEQHGHTPVVLPLGEPVDDSLLRTELLQPLVQKRTVLDE